MSKLDEAAEQYQEALLNMAWAGSPPTISDFFKAGALWLLEQAKRIEHYDPEVGEFKAHLEELCKEQA